VPTLRKSPPRKPWQRSARRRTRRLRLPAPFVIRVALGGIVAIAAIVAILQIRYTLKLQSPILLGFQWPIVMVPKAGEEAAAARADQAGRPLTAYQQYACRKFGPACRAALAIQRAENPRGACEIYHYNSDGTLDWGYFQINTVHLTRPGLNLRDLLDCRANIDFAYRLYQEHGFQPWSTYNNGAYRKFLRGPVQTP
jgi:hypothetical protein